MVYGRSRASKSETKRMVGNLKQTIEFSGYVCDRRVSFENREAKQSEATHDS